MPPLPSKVNCSKFIIDRLQQQCHVTFFVYIFITPINLLFGVFLPRKIITILRKLAVNFRQVQERLAKSFKSTSEKVESIKILYCTWTSSKIIFKVSALTVPKIKERKLSLRFWITFAVWLDQFI